MSLLKLPLPDLLHELLVHRFERFNLIGWALLCAGLNIVGVSHSYFAPAPHWQWIQATLPNGGKKSVWVLQVFGLNSFQYTMGQMVGGVVGMVISAMAVALILSHTKRNRKFELISG